MTLDISRPVRVAAVQMHGSIGDLKSNLFQAEDLAAQAFEAGARIVGLPEFFTTPVIFDERLTTAAVPADANPAEELLRELAAHYKGWIGGSALVRRGRDIFNTYMLAGPDGTVRTHDKDIPTMWESAFYRGGDDRGVLECEWGNVGAAVCWEMIRTQTVNRLFGNIRLAMTGSNWWTVPEGWPLLSSDREFAAANERMARTAPVDFARLLGVPVLHAAQSGPFAGRIQLLPWPPLSASYRSRFVGDTMIIDGDGQVLARRRNNEGPGFVAAEVMLEARDPVATFQRPGDFWIPQLTGKHKFFWKHQNMCGRWYYRTRRNRVERDRRAAARGRAQWRDRVQS